MERLEEIGWDYGKDLEEIEKDCFFILKCATMRNATPQLNDQEYLVSLLSILQNDGYIMRENGVSYSLTHHGKRALKRGCVYRDNKKERKKSRLKSAYYILTFIFAALAAVASILGLFF